MSFISYAQNFEDVLLHRVFGGQETGFYVDVGAYHPVDGSVTKAFYDRGWSGINIEPGSIYDELAASRPRDINLRMVALDHAGDVAFVEDPDDAGTSHVAVAEGEPGSRTVPCDTLESIVRCHSRGRPVDFLKVDAEGAEGAIARSTDWRRFRPRVLVFDATKPWSTARCNQDWEPILLEQGYLCVYFDGINCFYIPEEEALSLKRHFEAPVNVLDRVTRYDLAAATAMAEAAAEQHRLQTNLATVHATTAVLEAERAALHDANSELMARLVQSEAGLTALRHELANLATEHGTAKRDHAALRERQDALVAAHAQLEAEAKRLGTERSRLAAEHDALVVEHDALVARHNVLLAERNALVVQRDALGAERSGFIAQRTSLLAERDAAISQRDALAAEHDWLLTECQALITQRDALQERSGPTATGGDPATIQVAKPAREAIAHPQAVPALPRRQLRRRIARAAYMLVRPIARPIAWRLRTFMIAGLMERLNEQQQLRHQDFVGSPALMCATPSPDSVAELRSLAAEIETALLTLTLTASSSEPIYPHDQQFVAAR